MFGFKILNSGLSLKLSPMLSADFFFQNQLFGKILSGIPSECQTVRIQVRPDILPDLSPKCLQILSTDDTSRQRVNKIALTLVGKELINHIILVTVIVMWAS